MKRKWDEPDGRPLAGIPVLLATPEGRRRLEAGATNAAPEFFHVLTPLAGLS